MTGARTKRLAGLVGVSLIVVGCGGGGNGDGAAKSKPATGGGGGKSETVPPTPLTSDAPKNLPKPIYPRCAMPGYVRRVARLRSIRPGRKVWQVNYQVPPKKPSRLGQTTVVLLVEQPADVRVARKVAADPAALNIAGRRVQAKISPNQKSGIWTTGRATYSLIADGPRRTFERFVACVP